MGGSNYGHSQGLNMKNFKALDRTVRCGGHRPPKDWNQEVVDVVRDFSQEALTASRLRANGQKAMDVANKAISSQMTGTEKAIVEKINETQRLKVELEKTLLDTDLELQHQQRAKTQLERLTRRKNAALSVNERRLALRSQRPHRELTSDDVQLQLITQGQLLTNYVHKLGKGVVATELDICRLQDCRVALQADVHDKEEAIRIDRAALEAKSSDYGTLDGTLQRKSLVYPYTWHSSTENTVKTAKHWQHDAVALRRFLGKTVSDNRVADRKLKETLERAMQDRINWTRRNREALERQADEIQDEITRAKQRKLDLVEAARAKSGPAALAKHRYMMRKGRPEREQVQDAVEGALLAELNVIRTHTSTLNTQIAAIDHQIELLQGAWHHVQTNLADKRRGEQVDMQAAMLDGRSDVNRPSSSTSSVGSSMYSFKSEPHYIRERPTSARVSRPSSAHSRPHSSTSRQSETLARIAALESELAATRAARISMEQSVNALSVQAAA